VKTFHVIPDVVASNGGASETDLGVGRAMSGLTWPRTANGMAGFSVTFLGKVPLRRNDGSLA
jgi:hypothetical protein